MFIRPLNSNYVSCLFFLIIGFADKIHLWTVKILLFNNFLSGGIYVRIIFSPNMQNKRS